MDKVQYLRSKMPSFRMGTDIIVGFPSETRQQFQQTVDLIKQVRFSNVFAFVYSAKKGTKAAEMEDRVSEDEKTARIEELLAVQREIVKNNL
jgi:tRNA-2-methylthio-N6-dimethylallyladenosine synthase